VGLLKCALKKWLRHLEADEAVVLVEVEPSFRDLDDVEPELCMQVRRLVLVVSDGGTELLRKFREFDCHGAIDGGVSAEVRGVVGESTEREGEFVGIIGVGE